MVCRLVYVSATYRRTRFCHNEYISAIKALPAVLCISPQLHRAFACGVYIIHLIHKDKSLVPREREKFSQRVFTCDCTVTMLVHFGNSAAQENRDIAWKKGKTRVLRAKRIIRDIRVMHFVLLHRTVHLENRR